MGEKFQVVQATPEFRCLWAVSRTAGSAWIELEEVSAVGGREMGQEENSHFRKVESRGPG